MIGSRLMNCLNRLWQEYPCKYIPRHSSGCATTECKNPKCPGKPECDNSPPCCSPPTSSCCPPPSDPCACCPPKDPPCPPKPCCPCEPPCPPKPVPCCPPKPCCPSKPPCPPKPDPCCPKDPPCPPKPDPCCPPKPKCPPCPPKPVPCCPPKPCCPTSPPCPPKPDPCCPPKPKCPSCPPKPPCCPKKSAKPSCPCPPKSKSTPTCSSKQADMPCEADVDKAAKELCAKALETCAEARKILDFYRSQKHEKKDMTAKPTNSCPPKPSKESFRKKQQEKLRSKLGSADHKSINKEKPKASQTKIVDSKPKIYTPPTMTKKFLHTKAQSTSNNCVPSNSTYALCRNIRNPSKNKVAEPVEKRSKSQSVVADSPHDKLPKCDGLCPHGNKVGCTCSCIRGAKAKFKARLKNDFEKLNQSNTSATLPKQPTTADGQTRLRNKSADVVTRSQKSQEKPSNSKNPDRPCLRAQCTGSTCICNKAEAKLKTPASVQCIKEQTLTTNDQTKLSNSIHAPEARTRRETTSLQNNDRYRNKVHTPIGKKRSKSSISMAKQSTERPRMIKKCKKAQSEKTEGEQKFPTRKSCDKLVGDIGKKCSANCPLGKDESRPCTCIQTQKEIASSQIHLCAANKSKQSGSKHNLSGVCSLCKKGNATCTCKGDQNMAATKSHASCDKLAVNKDLKCNATCPLGKDKSRPCTCIRSQKDLITNAAKYAKRSRSEQKLADDKSKNLDEACPICKRAGKACKCRKGGKACTCKHAPKGHEKKTLRSCHQLVEGKGKECHADCPLGKGKGSPCTCIQTQKEFDGSQTHTCSDKYSKREQKLPAAKSQASLKDKEAKHSEIGDKLVTVKSLLAGQKVAVKKTEKSCPVCKKESGMCSCKKEKKACSVCKEENGMCSCKKEEKSCPAHSGGTCPTCKKAEGCVCSKSQGSKHDTDQSEKGITCPTCKKTGGCQCSKSHKRSATEKGFPCPKCKKIEGCVCSKTEGVKDKVCTIAVTCPVCKEDERACICLQTKESTREHTSGKSRIIRDVCPLCKKTEEVCTCLNSGQSRKFHQLATLKSREFEKPDLIQSEIGQKPIWKKVQNSRKECAYELEEHLNDQVRTGATLLCKNKEEPCTYLSLNRSQDMVRSGVNTNINDSSCRVPKMDSSTCTNKKQPQSRAQSTSSIPENHKCSCCKCTTLNEADHATPCLKCQKASKDCIEFLCKKYKRMQDKSKLSLRASFPCSRVSSPFCRAPESTILCNHQSIYKVSAALSQRLGVNLSSISRFSTKTGSCGQCGRPNSPCKNQTPTCSKKPQPICRMPGPCPPPSPCKQDSCGEGSSFVVRKPQCDLLCQLQQVFRDQPVCEREALNQYFGKCYKNKEYHMYHKDTFHELQVYMQKYRNRQPSNKCTLPKPPCSECKK